MSTAVKSAKDLNCALEFRKKPTRTYSRRVSTAALSLLTGSDSTEGSPATARKAKKTAKRRVRPDGLPALDAPPLLPGASASCPLLTAAQCHGLHEPPPPAPRHRHRHIPWRLTRQSKLESGHGAPKARTGSGNVNLIFFRVDVRPEAEVPDSGLRNERREGR
ncbi:hypothetical protein MC885_007428 [Smutsia gigantea]|nr:hypothetical protein MC885_007428 [Smutsia gigantea]